MKNSKHNEHGQTDIQILKDRHRQTDTERQTQTDTDRQMVGWWWWAVGGGGGGVVVVLGPPVQTGNRYKIKLLFT